MYLGGYVYAIVTSEGLQKAVPLIMLLVLGCQRFSDNHRCRPSHPRIVIWTSCPLGCRSLGIQLIPKQVLVQGHNVLDPDRRSDTACLLSRSEGACLLTSTAAGGSPLRCIDDWDTSRQRRLQQTGTGSVLADNNLLMRIMTTVPGVWRESTRKMLVTALYSGGISSALLGARDSRSTYHDHGGSAQSSFTS